MLGDLNIGWNHTYSCDASSGDATTRARPFELIYTACADIRNNLWYLRISSITGGTEIAVHMGNYQTPNPGVNILTEEDGCMAIIDMLLESSSYGPARRWVTELAIKTHEEWHRDEWIENS